MNRATDLETRVLELERSFRRTRLTAWALGLALTVLATTALTRQEPQDLTAERLVLTGGVDGSGDIALTAGAGPSLVIETGEGVEVLRLGGRAARPAR